jgi:molybdopterin synthase sulfur carrier subunit
VSQTGGASRTARGGPARDGGDVTVRYWAAARAASGCDSDVVRSGTVGQALDAVTALHPSLVSVAAVSTFLLDGLAVGREAPVGPGSVLEVLPPFAGG